MGEFEMIVWVVGIIAVCVTITSVVKSISEASARIKRYDNDPTIFNRPKEQQNDDEDDPEVR